MTVFVVQNQMRFDHDKGELVPRFNTLYKAEAFGKLQYLVSPTAHPFRPDTIIEEMSAKLSLYSPEDDYLLLIGNPALVGIATAIAAYYGDGQVRLLQWSGMKGDYTAISTRLF